MSAVIIIPARYGSTRFPGKPLATIAGRTLLERMIDLGDRAAAAFENVQVIVATDDLRIHDHALALGAACVMTDTQISSGSGRALAAAQSLPSRPDIIVNLQGDAPFIRAEALSAILQAIQRGDAQIATPVTRLSWAALDQLRAHKRDAPFSGTSCIRGSDGRALWFSKSILPAIREESELRKIQPLSPVFQHLGLYAYSFEALSRFEAAPLSHYEQLEGLEQLRFLEMGMPIAAIETRASSLSVSGIDTPQDARLAEKLIAEFGDPFGQTPTSGAA